MPRPLELLAPPTRDAEVDQALSRVAAALAGSGPALVPVPPDRRGGAVLAMARLDTPLEVGPSGEDVALVVPTSGSTGVVKGALLTSSALQHSAASALDRLGGPGQWLLALPTTSVGGISVLVRSVVGGTRPELFEPGDGFTVAGFVAATQRLTGPRRYAALVPTQVWRLAAGPPAGMAALAAYDAVLVGGSAFDDELAAAAAAAGARIVRTYGMTETCGGCVYDGAPLDEVDVRAPADGPIEIGGPLVFVGYRLRPDLTAAALRLDGSRRWHITDDAGAIGADGLLQVHGRLDDVIITGGKKVSAWAVRRVLAANPAVRAIEVLGVADDEWGHRVVAFVEAADRTDPPTLESIRAYGRPSLPTEGLPRQLVVLDAIPLLPSGKTDRTALRALAQ